MKVGMEFYIPYKYLLANVTPVADSLTVHAFAGYFSRFFLITVKKARVNSNEVYNGKCRLIVQNRNFMKESNVKECFLELSCKKICEEYDLIPVCTLFDVNRGVLLLGRH